MGRCVGSDVAYIAHLSTMERGSEGSWRPCKIFIAKWQCDFLPELTNAEHQNRRAVSRIEITHNDHASGYLRDERKQNILLKPAGKIKIIFAVGESAPCLAILGQPLCEGLLNDSSEILSSNPPKASCNPMRGAFILSVNHGTEGHVITTRGLRGRFDGCV